MAKQLQKTSWIRKLFERIYTEKFRLNILQALPFWIGSLLTGLVAVGYAKLFAVCETFSGTMFHARPWLLFLVTPLCFMAGWWIVKRFEPNADGSGIPQVMAAIELASPKTNYLVDKLLSVKSIVVKIISTLLMATGGATIGREGPTIQIAASIFRKVNQLLPDSWPKVSKKNMIMTGAAAGLAAAFNTPLGGIVFAVEELAKTHISYFKTALFTAVIIAGITAQSIMGSYLYLGYPTVGSSNWTMIFFVLIVALLCGILGTFMCKVILKVIHMKSRLTSFKGQFLFVLTAAVLVAVIAYFINGDILGSGKSDISRLLFSGNKHADISLPFIRMIGSVTAFTSGGAGGVFAPALGIGALVGGIVAEICSFSASNANILILCGMVAFLTGITRTPFTSAILVLEMTDRHGLIFYLMTAGLIAGLVSNLMDRHSLYDQLTRMYLHRVLKTEDLPVAAVAAEEPADFNNQS